MKKIIGIGLGGLLFLAAGCHTLSSPETDASPSSTTSNLDVDTPGPTPPGNPPAEVPGAEEPETVWEYIAAKYDGDADGKVSMEEYDRGEEVYSRLDRNEDGLLSEDDFQSRDRGTGGGRSGRRGGMSSRMLPRVMTSLFNGDEDRSRLSVDEMMASFSRFDTSGDDRLDAVEYAALVENYEGGELSRMERMMVTIPDEISALAELVAGEQKEAIERADLETSFARLDEDDDQLIEFDLEQMNRMGGARSRGDRGGRAMSGPAEGTPAPDFTLPLLDSAEEQTVTLSSFAGDRPVALIFGSYT